MARSKRSVETRLIEEPDSGTQTGARRFRRTTMKASQNSRAKTKRPSGRRGAKPDEMNQATVDEFEREGMGIAPKE
jgi:hypothetical protein